MMVDSALIAAHSILTPVETIKNMIINSPEGIRWDAIVHKQAGKPD